MAAPDILLDVLADFARDLSGHYDVSDVLDALTTHAAGVLGAAGAGVTLADGSGRLRFATASSDPVGRLEHAQEQHQAGPCHDAYTGRKPVLVEDIESTTGWPDYREICLAVGLGSVAGIPMLWNDEGFGALNVYRAVPGPWSDEDVTVARVLADMATSYVAHASQLDESRRLNEQLQEALDSRVLIEQAKGLIAGERTISLNDAYELLRRHARNHQASLRAVASAVVELGFRPED